MLRIIYCVIVLSLLNTITNMDSYCVHCRQKTPSKSPSNTMVPSKNGKRIPMQISTCEVCGSRKAKFLPINGFNEGTGLITDALDHISNQGKALITNAQKVIGKVKNTAVALLGGVRTHASPAVRSALKRYGSKKIVDAAVVRQPVESGVKKVVDFMTLGKLSENTKRLGYDDIFHLGLLVRLEDNTILKLEKNEVVVVKVVSDVNNYPDALEIKIPPNKQVPLVVFLNKAEQLFSENDFWLYDPITNNCQVFVKNLLEGNELLTQDLEDFIMQDARALIEDDPVFKRVGRMLTDLGGIFDIVKHGQSLSS